VRIATWNINGLRARLDFVLHWLEARRPDVVGLQELKLEEAQFPRLTFEQAGYHALIHGQKSWNGVAILSREKAEAVEVGLPGQEALGARLLTADLGGGLAYTTVYCPNGKSVDHEDFARKLVWFEALADRFAANRKPDEALLLGGDFNICPAPIDSWNEEKLAGKIFHTEAERERFQRLLDWGFVDAFRRLYPDDQKFSWWDYRGGAFHRKMGLRIDLMLATPPAMERIRQVEIDRDYRKKKEGLTASDHAPVIADLE